MAFSTPIRELIERNANGLLGKHPSWERIPLGKVAEVQNGAAFRSEYFNTDGRGVPLIRIRDVLRGATDTYYDGPVDDGYVVAPGDLIIGMDGDFNHAFWTGSPALLNQRVCRLRFTSHELRPQWVYWLLGGYLEAVNRETHSVTVKHLSSRTVANLELPVPSVEEQEQIVQQLELFASRIREGIESFNQAARRAGDLRTAALAGLVSDAPTVTIGSIGRVFVGATPSRSDQASWGGTVAWVSSGEVAFCRIKHTRESITEKGLGNGGRRLHPPGTVLLAMIGEGKTRGQAAILDIPAAHNQNSAAIRLDEDRMIPEFLYYCLVRQYEDSRRGGAGSQQPALNKSKVEQMSIPCPPVERQRYMVELLDRLLPELERREQEFAALRSRSEALRRALILAAVEGRLIQTNGDVT